MVPYWTYIIRGLDQLGRIESKMLSNLRVNIENQMIQNALVDTYRAGLKGFGQVW